MIKIYCSILLAMWFCMISPSYARDFSCSSLGKEWLDFNEGACRIETNISSDSKKHKLNGFVFDMRKYRIELLGTGEASINSRYFANNLNTYNYTVNEVIEQTQGNGVVVSSIGYPRSLGEHFPRGLLQIKGTVISELNLNTQTKKYLTAILCFDEQLSPEKILVTAPRFYFVGTSSEVDITWKTSTCDNAIQVGPRIVEKAGQPLVKKEISKQSEDRITLSIGSDYYVYLLHWKEMTLKDVQDVLLSGQLGKTSSPLWAVNISLRDIAGIATKDMKIGETNSTNSAFITFSPTIKQ
jgi:hypothetical protein